MANCDYTYDQVKGGTGAFKKETAPVYSEGVATLQARLNSCGYSLDADGKFGPGTDDAVRKFQKECQMTDDGSAGPATLKQVDKVYTNKYFTSNNTKISNTAWGYSEILSGRIPDIELLAIMIYYEETVEAEAQYGVAQVIKNRSNNNAYMESISTAPNASKWGRVLGKSSQYSGANKTSTPVPIRGKSSEIDGINPLWKNAVDIATNLVNGSAITIPKGYVVTYSVNKGVVSFSIASSKTTAVASQLCQASYTHLSNQIGAGKTGSSIITYEPSFVGAVNVFYNLT